MSSQEMAHSNAAKKPGESRRFLLLYVLPSLVLITLAVLPLIRGAETLYFRDIFGTHLPMKFSQSEAMRDGRLPLIDLSRSGGQPHLGNPNTVPLYPTNLLYLIASTFWALNAHFWIHLLIAPAAGYVLGRAWGLRREAAWACGVCYAGSGYFFSHLNLYNLIAGVSLAPALVGFVLRLAAEKRKSYWFAATVGCWFLLLLAGDPTIAALAFGAAILAVLVRGGVGRTGWLTLSAATLLGALIAAPQLVEFIRILPLSFRGFQGYSASAATAASWYPGMVVEWLIPLVFGRPELDFWGIALFAGKPPFYYSLYPGILAIGLIAACGKWKRAAVRWGWAVAAVGLFFVLGNQNPLLMRFLEGMGSQLVRFPIKFWLLIALGGAVLSGVGFERLMERRGLRPFLVVMLGLSALFLLVGVSLWLPVARLAEMARAIIPAHLGDEYVDAERMRWVSLSLGSALLALVYGAAIGFARRDRARVVGGCLLLVHLGVQLVVMRPLMPTEPVTRYLAKPLLQEALPPSAVLVHGNVNRLFGRVSIPVDRYPTRGLVWLQRQTFDELFPGAGLMSGNRYEFIMSAEGLDAFMSRAATQAIQGLPDRERLGLMAASGTDLLLLGRELDPAARGGAELLARVPTFASEVFVYRIAGAADPIQFVSDLRYAPNMNEALRKILEPAFDPRRAVVLLADGASIVGRGGGGARVLVDEPEKIEVRIDASSPGALVVQRTHLPLYRASVDGEKAEILEANLHRMAVEVPAGVHEVRIWVDRRPFLASLVLAFLGFLELVVMMRRLGAGGEIGDSRA